ncbi:MAG: hypothetical protein WA463_14365 [Terriglobales bacterium]
MKAEPPDVAQQDKLGTQAGVLVGFPAGVGVAQKGFASQEEFGTNGDTLFAISVDWQSNVTSGVRTMLSKLNENTPAGMREWALGCEISRLKNDPINNGYSYEPTSTSNQLGPFLDSIYNPATPNDPAQNARLLRCYVKLYNGRIPSKDYDQPKGVAAARAPTACPYVSTLQWVGVQWTQQGAACVEDPVPTPTFKGKNPNYKLTSSELYTADVYRIYSGHPADISNLVWGGADAVQSQ